MRRRSGLLQRTRRSLLALCVTGLVTIAVVWIATPILKRSFMDEAASQAASALRLAVAALNGHLKRYEALPALIADHDDIQDLLADPGNPELRQTADLYLKAINALLKSSEIYVMKPDGETIAASNFDTPTSFVGENFSYRPYFQQAIAGQTARFYALGTTSAKRGYYFSAPVRIAGAIRGAIVFKVDVDLIEASWRDSDYKIFVSDPEGIIFMSGNPDWLYASLVPLTPDRLARTAASRRYADKLPHTLPVTRSRVEGHDILTMPGPAGATRDYLLLSEAVEDAGWTVNVLTDTASAVNQWRTALAAIVLSICFAALVFFVLIQRKARRDERMLMDIQAKAELERRVAERTADLAYVNRKLRDTQSDLIQAAKLAGLGQMSAALSHEFNQPLAAVRNYAESAELLISRDRLPEARDNLARIGKLVDRMASLSQHLRNFARKPNERLDPVSLDAVLEDTLEIVRPRLATARATVTVDLGEPAPVVLAGPIRLQQVLVNIVTNAADAVEEKDDRRITLTARRAQDNAVIEIRDRGDGVSPAIAARIFDPFFTTKGVGKGLGLGLSISYNIVKDFGGDLTVANHAEGGAVFSIVIPLAVPQKEAAQ
ncbi:two-component sensor histidine kinase [Rhizobium rhizosphaerae]|uniref:C4-dicarboxylate transport sensor protein n=1 Tax=Xaviernesmea rhizosphaerae TaxID=1672749 RepID=A0A1Q9AHW7_9HYPH|nr:two-component sensor histidine kinase [Xaviernesmea rhizosphaerae]